MLKILKISDAMDELKEIGESPEYLKGYFDDEFCNACGKKPITYFIIFPTGDYENTIDNLLSHARSERDLFACSEECANLLALQNL